MWTYLTRRFIKSQYQFPSLRHRLRAIWKADLSLVVKRNTELLSLASLSTRAKPALLGTGPRAEFSRRWFSGLPCPRLSERIVRAMAPGAAQHFCRGDERSLVFMFPGSDRAQNYGPETLFRGAVAAPDQSVSAVVNSLLYRIKTVPPTAKYQLRAAVGYTISVSTSSPAAHAAAFPSRNLPHNSHPPAPRVQVSFLPPWPHTLCFQTSICSCP